MWKFVFESITGTSHNQSGQPCQDFCKAIIPDFGDSDLLIATCSDGAGSASQSDLGAKEACECFLAEANLWLRNCGHSEPPDHETLRSWVDAARNGVLAKAMESDALPRDLACTLIGVVVAENWAAFVQIGDGAIVFDCEGSYQVAFWPENGEYANTTFFLTDELYATHVRTDIIAQEISDLAVFTDGLQMLALDYAGTRPHGRFFTPLFDTVRSSSDQGRLQDDLISYLSSERMNNRTDDDKSLLLATRVKQDHDIQHVIPQTNI